MWRNDNVGPFELESYFGRESTGDNGPFPLQTKF